MDMKASKNPVKCSMLTQKWMRDGLNCSAGNQLVQPLRSFSHLPIITIGDICDVIVAKPQVALTGAIAQDSIDLQYVVFQELWTIYIGDDVMDWSVGFTAQMLHIYLEQNFYISMVIAVTLFLAPF